MQRWSSDFQGLFCVKIRKMAQGSNDLSTLPLIKNSDEVSEVVSEVNQRGQVSSIKTYDFSTLYTNLPHKELKERIPSRGVTREGHEGRAHPPKNFDFGFWTERGETIAPQRCFPEFCWMQTSAEDPKITFASYLSLTRWCRRKRHEKAKEDRQFCGVLALAYSHDRATTCDWSCCQRSGTTCCSASDHLNKKDTTLRWKPGKSDLGQRDKVPSVPVSGWFESCSCWFLESASEVKQRENDEKLKSLVHHILCFVQNILLRCHPNEKWTKQQFLAQQCKWWSWIVLLDKEAGSPGNSIALLKFQAQADDAALLRNLHCNTYKRGKQVKHLSPKIQNELTDCWRKALALASAGGCKSSIRIKYNNVCSVVSHPPSPLLSCVSLLLSKFCQLIWAILPKNLCSV